jgi:hypothetical protein
MKYNFKIITAMVLISIIQIGFLNFAKAACKAETCVSPKGHPYCCSHEKPDHLAIPGNYKISCSGVERQTNKPLEVQFLYNPEQKLAVLSTTVNAQTTSITIQEPEDRNQLMSFEATDFYGDGNILDFTANIYQWVLQPPYCLRCQPDHDNVWNQKGLYTATLSLYKSKTTNDYTEGAADYYNNGGELQTFTFKNANCKIDKF